MLMFSHRCQWRIFIFKNGLFICRTLWILTTGLEFVMFFRKCKKKKKNFSLPPVVFNIVFSFSLCFSKCKSWLLWIYKGQSRSRRPCDVVVGTQLWGITGPTERQKKDEMKWMKILLGTPLKIQRWTVISGGALSCSSSTTPLITPLQSPGRGCQSDLPSSTRTNVPVFVSPSSPASHPYNMSFSSHVSSHSLNTCGSFCFSNLSLASVSDRSGAGEGSDAASAVLEGVSLRSHSASSGRDGHRCWVSHL